MLQNVTPLRKSAPWPRNSSDEHVSCTAPATENASLQILFKCPTPAIVCGNATKPSRFAHFWQGAQSLAPATQSDASTCKSGAYMWCFVDFWFGNVLRATTACTCWTSQLPEHEVLCAFWLQNVLLVTTARTLSTSQLLKVLRSWGVLYILAWNWKCALRHNVVQLVISHLTTWLRRVGKTKRFATFLPFRTWIFFLRRLSLFDLHSSSLLFSDPGGPSKKKNNYHQKTINSSKKINHQKEI